MEGSTASVRVPVALLAVSAAIVLPLLFSPVAAASSTTVSMSLSYSVVGLAAGSAPPSFTYFYQGQQQVVLMSSTPAQYSVDIGTPWSVSAVLPGSNNTERWITQDPSGITSNANLTFRYYQQYRVDFNDSVVEGGTGPITVDGPTQFGAAVALRAGSAAWVDSGSAFSYPSEVSQSPGERWVSDGLTGLISGPANYFVSYFHQYLFIASYYIVDGGTPSSPIFRGISFNSLTSLALSGTNSSIWLDAGTQFQATSPLGGSNSSVRWFSQGAEGLVSSPKVISFAYYHQYSIVGAYSIVGGKSPAVPALLSTTFGSQTAQYLSESPKPIWLDAGSTYSLPGLLSGSSSTERWSLAESMAGVVDASTKLDAVYYHQYVLSFQYKTPYESFPAPDLQITSFGAPVRLPLNQGFTSVWGDNGTSIVLAGNQTYLGQGERWAESTRIPGNLTSSMIITLRFVHQYEVTLSYTIVGGGNPTSPEIVGFSLERPLEANVTMQGSTFWLDATTPWSVSSILPGGTSGVRWVAATHIGGNLTGSLEASVSYVHQYYVTVNPVSTGGSTSLSSGWYDANSNLSLSANPSLGWIFGHWVGAYSGENSTVAVQLKGPVQETPVFEAILQISTGSMGSVTYVTNGASHVVGPMRSAAVSVEQGGNVTLLASPSSFFYTFAGWGGNLSSDDPRIALAVTSPAEIRASFSLNYFAVVGVIAVWVIGVSFVSFLILRRRQSLRRLLEPFQRLKGGPNQ